MESIIKNLAVYLHSLNDHMNQVNKLLTSLNIPDIHIKEEPIIPEILPLVSIVDPQPMNIPENPPPPTISLRSYGYTANKNDELRYAALMAASRDTGYDVVLDRLKYLCRFGNAHTIDDLDWFTKQKNISLRVYGYRCYNNDEVRRASLTQAMAAKGYDIVLHRLNILSGFGNSRIIRDMDWFTQKRTI